MPRDPNLYGQRPAKRKAQASGMGLASSLDFSAQLQTAISASASSSSSSSFKAKKLKANDDLSHVRVRGSRPREAGDSDSATSTQRRIFKNRADRAGASAPLDTADRTRIRDRLAAKARLYARMQRGDDVPGVSESASLVDFDRKLAEQADGGTAPSDTDSDNDSDASSASSADGNNADDMEQVELTDEFGRTRMVPRRVHDREMRRRARRARATADLVELRARPPTPPAGVLRGDVIQTEAFAVGEAAHNEAETTDDHYRAAEDVRTRGAVFYALNADDEEARAAQLKALADARARTEAARAQHMSARDASVAARREQLAARKAQLAARTAARADAQAVRFLDTLGEDLAGMAQTATDTDGASADASQPGT